MCDPTENFLLCTCLSDDKPLERPHWILRRDNQNGYLSDERTHLESEIVGIFAMDAPLFTGDADLAEHELKRREIRRHIKNELNARNCFDFTYRPALDDVLTIRLIDMEFHFQFVDFGESFVAGYRRNGSWISTGEPTEFFHMAEGMLGSISPERQIRKKE